MTPEEQQYYEQLRLARLQDEAREKMAGQAAGRAAQAAAIATGVGAPLGFAAKKVGEQVGKQAYRRLKWVIPIVIAIASLVVFAFIAFIIFVPIIATYVVICYNPVGVVLWLVGLMPCF